MSQPEEFEVRISLTNKSIGNRRVVRSGWLAEDPIASQIVILRMRNQTNYPITEQESRRISQLVSNTGNDWTRNECIAALKVHCATYEKPLSRLSRSPVSDTALLLGRAVTGVYNKVLNFRHLDPRDERAGLPNINAMDRSVWAEFYNTDSNRVMENKLNEAYSQIYFGKIVTPRSHSSYKDFGDAPNDDPTELQNFAKRVRRGQTAFRDNLLRAYGRACAITGEGPEEALEAVHIVPHSESGINELNNGLLLRADPHHLFDDNLLKINPTSLNVGLDDRLRDTSYWQYNGAQLRHRTDGSQISTRYLLVRSSAN